MLAVRHRHPTLSIHVAYPILYTCYIIHTVYAPPCIHVRLGLHRRLIIQARRQAPQPQVLGRRPFVVLREKHEIGICYQIGTVDTFKAPSIPVTNLGLI